MLSYHRGSGARERDVPRRVGVTAPIGRGGGRFLVERRVDDVDVLAFVGGTLENDERLVDEPHPYAPVIA